MSLIVVYVFASIFPVIGVNPVMFNVERRTCYMIYFRHVNLICVVSGKCGGKWKGTTAGDKKGDVESPLCVACAAG